MSELTALYLSDFYIKDRRTLNTLCLFYDRLFLHDYFGIWGCVDSQKSYNLYQTNDETMIKALWEVAGGLNDETKLFLKGSANDTFEALILKGVSQGLGCQTGKFSPSFVINFAKDYSTFVRDNHLLFTENVLGLCESLKNPYHPANRLEGGVKLDIRCNEKENQESLEKSRLNNKRGCLFEQQYHKLPLISDSAEDLLKWDREKDLLTASILLAVIPTRVPTIAEAPAEDILEAREKLKDYLPPFRNTILEAAWEIATASRESSRDEVSRLARLYYSTKIEPAVAEIESKLESENTKLFRKLVDRGIDKTVLLAKSLDPTEPLSKWDLIASGVKSLLDIDESIQSKAEIKSPFEFLVHLPKLFRNLK